MHIQHNNKPFKHYTQCSNICKTKDHNEFNDELLKMHKTYLRKKVEHKRISSFRDCHLLDITKWSLKQKKEVWKYMNHQMKFSE